MDGGGKEGGRGNGSFCCRRLFVVIVDCSSVDFYHRSGNSRRSSSQ
jgi:hypothetical protein